MLSELLGQDDRQIREMNGGRPLHAEAYKDERQMEWSLSEGSGPFRSTQ